MDGLYQIVWIVESTDTKLDFKYRSLEENHKQQIKVDLKYQTICNIVINALACIEQVKMVTEEPCQASLCLSGLHPWEDCTHGTITSESTNVEQVVFTETFTGLSIIPLIVLAIYRPLKVLAPTSSHNHRPLSANAILYWV